MSRIIKNIIINSRIIVIYDSIFSFCSRGIAHAGARLKGFLAIAERKLKPSNYEQENFLRDLKRWSEKSYADNRSHFLKIIPKYDKKTLLAYCATAFLIPSNQENLAIFEYIAVNCLEHCKNQKGRVISPFGFYRLCNIAFKIQQAEVWRTERDKEEIFSAHIENLILRGTGRRADQSFKSAIYRFNAHNPWLQKNLGFSVEETIHIASEVVDSCSPLLRNFLDAYSIIGSETLEKIALVFDQYRVIKAPQRKAVQFIKNAFTINSFIERKQATKMQVFLDRFSSYNYIGQVGFGDEICLYDKPIAKIDDDYFLPFPSLMIEGLPEFFYKDLRTDVDYWRNQGEKKGKAAEKRIIEILSKAFPRDFIFPNPMIKKGSELIDALIFFEDKVIVIESKSRFLAREARKSPEIVNKYINETIIKGCDQAAEAEKVVNNKKITYLTNDRGNKIDISKRRVVQFFSLLILDERLSLMVVDDVLKKNKQKYNNPPFIVDINDLEYIAEEFDTPREFIKYLIDRQKFLSSGKYNSADELGLLGYYKINGRNFSPIEGEEKADRIVLDGFWEAYQRDYEKPNIKKTEEDRVSYFVDHLIERAHEAGDRSIMVAEELSKLTRTERRSLGEAALKKSMLSASDGKPHFFLSKFGSVDYGVIILFSHESRKKRIKRIQSLTHLSRFRLKIAKMIGIATDPANSPATSIDYGILNQPYEDDEEMIKLADQFFAPAEQSTISEYENEKLEEMG